MAKGLTLEQKIRLCLYPNREKTVYQISYFWDIDSNLIIQTLNKMFWRNEVDKRLDGKCVVYKLKEDVIKNVNR